MVVKLKNSQSRKLFKITLSLVISFSCLGCKAQKKISYHVEEINDDKCTELYYRLKLKNLANDSVFQVLSTKDKSGQRDIKEGDNITIHIEKTKRTEWKLDNLRPDNYTFYCDGKEVIKSTEDFYKTKDIIGLRFVK